MTPRGELTSTHAVFFFVFFENSKKGPGVSGRGIEVTFRAHRSGDALHKQPPKDLSVTLRQRTSCLTCRNPFSVRFLFVFFGYIMDFTGQQICYDLCSGYTYFGTQYAIEVSRSGRCRRKTLVEARRPATSAGTTRIGPIRPIFHNQTYQGW